MWTQESQQGQNDHQDAMSPLKINIEDSEDREMGQSRGVYTTHKRANSLI